MSDLRLCSSLITHLGVLSPNEILDDINTRDLRSILVDGLRGEMTLLLKTTSPKERIANLAKATVRRPLPGLAPSHRGSHTPRPPVRRYANFNFPRGSPQTAQDQFRKYVELVDRYEIIPQTQRAVFAGPQHATQDPAARRASKIAQFKMERDIKATLEVSACSISYV